MYRTQNGSNHGGLKMGTIATLEKDSKVINLLATITHLDEPTETPNKVPVQEGVISDRTGQVKISLWNDQVGQFKVGDTVMIATGWCKEFNGDLQVSTGKFGKIGKITAKDPTKVD